MKIFIRNAFFFFPIAIVLLLTAACVEGTDEPKDKTDDGDYITYGPFNLGAKLDVKDEQVWMPNYNTGKVSQMLLKFAGDRTVDVIVELIVRYDGDGTPIPSIEKAGSGEIKKGILSFKVDGINDKLLDSDDLLFYYFKDWYKTGNNLVMTPEVKGNIITFVTLYNDDPVKMPSEAIIREGFSGTSDSFTGKYIYYLYVEADCTISVKEAVIKPELEYTFEKFNDLKLKAGWNTICKSETYTTIGKSSYSMEVSNPSIRWVMQKIKF
jgi:hypothetical protein